MLLGLFSWLFGGRRRRLRKTPLSAEAWGVLERNLPYLKSLTSEDRGELAGLVQIFLDEKRFEGCGGLEITPEIRLVVAAQACMLLLRRETDVYPGLHSIIIYPSAYVAKNISADGFVVSEGTQLRAGQTWTQGSLVLSWDDVLRGAADVHDGHNVVFHEFAHQLDQQSGAADGTPPLPDRSRYVAWARELGKEYRELLRRIEAHRPTSIDPYGGTNPAEFFAVVTETFFERPCQLEKQHPGLYEQLRLFYRRDPAAIERGEAERLGGGG